MGRLSLSLGGAPAPLRRVLTVGLVLILFLSLFLSALGVAALVRGYLWNRGSQEAQLTGRAVSRLLQARQNRALRNPGNRIGNKRRVLGNLRRLNRGPNQILLLKNGHSVLQQEVEDRDWSGLPPLLEPGLHRVEYDGEEWQVLTRPVDTEIADQIAVIRPWTPSKRLVRTLILYQVVASVVVMGLAVGAVAWFSSRLARPLEELRENTEVVGRSSVTDLEDSSVLELAALQDAFLDMSQRVENAMASQRQFVADASHELKTPLTAISGMLELLESRPDMEAEDRAQALKVASKESQRMATLIGDLLLLSRAQAKRSGQKTLLKPAELLAEQMNILGVLFPEQDFELVGDPELELEINPHAFSRIARNLMENAARYAGGGSVQLHLHREGEQLIFAVKDSGPGIPAEKQSNLFERFYRTDSGRARGDGGHGLGLAIVKALVEEANGEISCRSVPGEGTEFRIRFFRKP